LWADLTGYGLPIGNRRHSRQGCLRYDGGGDVVYVYKRWKIGNIGYIVGLQQLKWQQIGNTIGNNRQQPKLGLPLGKEGESAGFKIQNPKI